ncbi:hypothetical protein [Flavivirga jejuensis]|uniref:Tetratricopeptide repeat protein n=1 Tax=Flavivirga jejuensis TaxID=870487 RepID=A0ABT8WQN4_9FLAO|nr:hypothetical protein [Flavivirga jejuensis]MDO5975465.1 hypothetical protein [Flavivirga jejuensis]
MNFKITSNMIGWIIFIAGGIALIGSQVLRLRGEKKTKLQDDGIEKNMDGVAENKIGIRKLADDFRAFQQLNISDKFESYVDQEYGLTKVGLAKLLSDNILNSKSQLNKGLAYYLSNDTLNAIPIFTELIKETNPFEVRAISNSYLGRMEFYIGNLTKESSDYLLEAENLFKKFTTEDEDVKKVRATNYYDLAYYFKTHSHDFKLSQTYYLNSIEIYESINEDTSALYSSKLGAVYNDLYLLTNQGKLEGDTSLFLQRAKYYKLKSLNKKYDDDTFFKYINSLEISGTDYSEKEDYTNSFKEFEKAFKLLNDKILKNPSSKEFKLRKAETFTKVSKTYLGKYEKDLLEKDLIQAQKGLASASQIFQQNLTSTVSKNEIIILKSFHQVQGRFHRITNQYPEAISEFNESLKYIKHLISFDDSNLDYINYEANINYELALTYVVFPNNRGCIKAKDYAEKALYSYNKTGESRKLNKPFIEICNNIIKKCN